MSAFASYQGLVAGCGTVNSACPTNLGEALTSEDILMDCVCDQRVWKVIVIVKEARVVEGLERESESKTRSQQVYAGWFVVR